jgi:hypothetical protein
LGCTHEELLATFEATNLNGLGDRDRAGQAVRETVVERRLMKKVREAGGLCFKWVPIVAGLPDRVVILPGGRIFLVETKAPGGEVRPAQAVMHSRMAERGVQVVLLWDSAQVDAWVAEHAV